MGLLEQLVAEIQQKQKGVAFKDAASTPSLPYYTGPGGLFGVAGLERDVISSRIMPMGLADRLPAVGTNVVNPLFPYLTGFQAATGSNPDGVCDDPMTVGAGKSCIQTAQFGRYSYQTRTLEFDRLGEQMNRGEFMDLRFMNDPLGGPGGLITPSGISQQANLSREVLMRFIEVGVQFQNVLGRQLYEGNPANNTGGGGYQEFPGLDILVGTDKVDALTNTACPSLDSDIKPFGYGRVDANGGNNIINVMSYLMRYLRYNAEHMNFGATTWAIVMRPELFYEMTAVWPCNYLTYRCQTTTGNEAIVNASDAVNMRDEMRRESYLIIDGIRFPVIQDSFIREDTNTTNGNVTSDCFGSDIYVIPMTVRGGVPVTYWEYKDYNRNMALMADARFPANFFWTDGGRYAWHFKNPTNWCLQWLAKIEPRVILRTPQLAGRITNVVYCPLQHTRDPINTDPYFVNGGQSTARTTPSLYADWGQVVP